VQRTWILFIAVIAVLVLSAFAQDLVVDVNLRLLNVSVQDRSGRPVLDLGAEDFEIVEDGQATPVKDFDLIREPVTIGLVLDRSTSIAHVRKDLDREAEKVIDALSPRDTLFLITFAGESKLSVRSTTQPADVLSAIRKTKLSLGTRFYDAVMDSLSYLSTSSGTRKVLVVLSDGADHYSVNTLDNVLRAARRYGYPIFLFGHAGDDPLFWSENGVREVRDAFCEIAAVTKGRAYFPSRGADTSKVARDIVDANAYVYELGFYSAAPSGVARSVHVRVRDQRFDTFTVRVLPDAIPAS